MELIKLLLLASVPIGGPPDAVPVSLKSRVIEASVFKSGLVLVTREVTVPAGDGKYTLDEVPLATDGSFWYSSPDGTLVTDVQTTLRTKDETVKANAQTVGDFLAANVGQHVKLSYKTITYGVSTKESVEQIEGIVNGPPRAQTNIVPIKLSNGHLRNLSLSSIEDIDTTGLRADISRTYKSADLKLQFRAQANRPTKLDFITLETGAAWVGSYLVKLKSTGGGATVVGKAQVALGRLTFDDTNVKALAGQPYMVTNNKYDLNSGVGGLSSYLGSSQESQLAYHPGPQDPFSFLQQYANDAAQAAQMFNNQGIFSNRAFDAYGYGYAGLGGGIGGGGRGNVDDVNSLEPTSSLRSNNGGFNYRAVATQATTDRLESLYSYPLGKVSLQAGDRLSRILFSQSSTYENIFRWAAEVGNDSSTVKSVLRIQNTGTVPWTGGLVMVTKEDSPLAQLEMPFTAAGKFADLEMANAQDMLVKKEETEISRDTIPMPGRPKVTLLRQLNEVHLSVESTRLETATFEITLQVPGDVADANGGKVDKLLTRQDGWNKYSRITWSFNLSPGEKREFRLQYHHIG